MVRGGFCERSEFGCMEPAVGIGSGHMNVLWRDDQQRKSRGIRQRIDFLAFANAQCGSAKQEKWDVGPQAGGNIKKTWNFELLTRELQIAQERRCCVAGAPAQSAARRDFFLECDFDTGP